MPRLFLAIPIPASITKRLAAYQQSLDVPADARLVTPEQFHVTVLFLGDVAASRVDELRRVIQRAVAQHEPFRLSFERVEDNGRGHIWARFASDDVWLQFWRPIAVVARDFAAADDGREQLPHITLARVKTHLAVLPPLRLAPLTVRHVELWQSELRLSGSVYTPIASFSLRRETDFAERVRAVVRSIPRGTVRSYGEVARLAGRPGAARAVGTVMAGNLDPTVPCHRVIAASGRIGDFNRGETPDRGRELKMELLKKEGVAVVGGRVRLTRKKSSS